MTNTQTKVAKLTRRVERLETALEAIDILAGPMDSEAPAALAAYHKLRAIVAEIKIEKMQ